MGRRTPLFDWHSSNKGRIVDFAGWEMPVIYSSINEEHQSVRTAAGLFDISHMGRLRISGPHAQRWLDGVLTNRVDTLKPGQVRYSLVLDENAGILDDVLLTRFADHYLLVVNASNREKLLALFSESTEDGVEILDETAATAMIACQGPSALAFAQPLVQGVELSGLAYYFAAPCEVLGASAVASRTGYTGEDGVELIVPASKAVEVWEQLLAAGARPCGLGARDTLRLEAGMPLYGHELSDTIDPIQAGLSWAVKAADKEFIGKDALSQREPNRRVRVGLKLEGKRIAREGFGVLREGEPIGVVTSGTFSPTLASPIAMAYVEPAYSTLDSLLEVDVRGEPAPAHVVSLPFYRRKK